MDALVICGVADSPVFREQTLHAVNTLCARSDNAPAQITVISSSDWQIGKHIRSAPQQDVVVIAYRDRDSGSRAFLHEELHRPDFHANINQNEWGGEIPIVALYQSFSERTAQPLASLVPHSRRRVFINTPEQMMQGTAAIIDDVRAWRAERENACQRTEDQRAMECYDTRSRWQEWGGTLPVCGL